jgi:hypothetical protein
MKRKENQRMRIVTSWCCVKIIITIIAVVVIPLTLFLALGFFSIDVSV